MEGIPVDLDERTVNTVAKMGDYVSMGERLVLRVSMIHHYELWFHGEIPLTITIETLIFHGYRPSFRCSEHWQLRGRQQPRLRRRLRFHRRRHVEGKRGVDGRSPHAYAWDEGEVTWNSGIH